MTNLILRVLDGFQWLFRLLKVDYPKFRALLWVKLTIDNREEKSVAQRRSDRQVTHSMIWVMVFYVFIGIVFGLVIIPIKSLFVSLVLIYSIIMLMTAVSLISDFTSVLLDTTDNAILQFRPIDGRTFAVARIVHIILYMLMITLSLSLGTLVFGTIKHGPLFTLLFLVSLLFTVLFVVFVSNLFYLFLIKVSGEKRFRDIILYFQIFMAAVAMGSYLFLPRLLNLTETSLLKNFTLEVRWWTYFIPPAWLAAPVDAAVTGVMSREALFLTLIGIFLPVACIVIVVRYLAPGFNKALLKIENAGSVTETRIKGQKFLLFFSRLVASRPAERAAFQFIWRISSRDPKFKLKVYPNFGVVLAMAAFMTLNRRGGLIKALLNLPNTKSYLIFLYIGSLIIPEVLLQVRLSDQSQAAWVYHSLPIARPGEVIRGGIKAMIFKFGGIIFILLSVLTLSIWGWRVVDDICLAFLNMVVMSYAIALTVKNDLPFAKAYGVAREAQKGIAGFLLMVIPAMLGLAHFLLTFIPYGVLIALPLSAMLIWPLEKIIGSTGWDSIKPF
jgi:ABC-2 type transport system permease protein